MSKTFDRGARAAKRGRPLESNPFARRGQLKRAAQWAEGWHSVDYRPVIVSADWKWPPIRPVPSPQPGDYWVRERGLVMLFRPRELVEFDVLRHEMRLGLVSYVPGWAVIPYACLWAYARHRRGVGNECVGEPVGGHPLKWLWSCLKQQPDGGHFPVLISSAYEELQDGSLFEPLSDD